MPRAARSIAILLSLCLGAIAPLARAAPAAHAAPAATYTLDFCQPASWKSACELQAKHHARRDVFCSERLSPLRDALVSYCARHSAALRDVAEHGTTAAKKYRYVAAVYGHESGLGNRMPGMVSGLFLALMTDRIFIHDYKVTRRWDLLTRLLTRGRYLTTVLPRCCLVRLVQDYDKWVRRALLGTPGTHQARALHLTGWQAHAAQVL